MDELQTAVTKLVTDGLIDAEQSGPIYRLCKLFKEGGHIPDEEFDRWKALGYIVEDEKGYKFEMEDGDEPLNWSLMGQVWSGILERKKIKGEWIYKITEYGKERTAERIRALTEQDKES